MAALTAPIHISVKLTVKFCANPSSSTNLVFKLVVENWFQYEKLAIDFSGGILQTLENLFAY